MSKEMSTDLLATRDHFAYLFRSSEEKISTFLNVTFTEEKIELLNKDLIDHLWDVGLSIVKECVMVHNDITKAENLLDMFSNYKHTFSPKIQEGFIISSTSLANHINLSEASQSELTGANDTPTTTNALE